MNFRHKRQIEPTPVQLAPLVDVLFLLVIFFAVTLHYGNNEQEIDISVPAAEKGKEPNARSQAEITINVRNNGDIVVNSIVTSPEALLTKLNNITMVFKDQAVVLRGDKATDYHHIIRVLDICQKAGIWNIAFATVAPESQP
jgi:biopolymer transport protein ExbD